jgi:thymidylate kinase
MVVICDRFPQTQFPGLNDGPWLGHWLRHPSSVRQAVARRELAAIRSAEQQAPDLVVKLHVPLHTAQARRPNTPTEQLARKAQQIRALQYPGAGRIVDIDASQPLERVLLDVKRALWECV